jgi:hypothetical protein
MSDSEGAPASGDHETQVGDISGAVHTRRGDVIHIEKIEWMAERVRDTLQHSLPTDEQVRAELREVITELTALQAQMTEWKELHHLLHEVLAAFSLFHARLILCGKDGFSAAERQALLQSWRPCQDGLDMLADFAEEIKHIGRQFRREGRELRGERWVVEIIALQLLFEDMLKEDNPSPESLLELAEEFNSACHRHLALADRKLRAVVDKLQRLSTRLLGGMV